MIYLFFFSCFTFVTNSFQLYYKRWNLSIGLGDFFQFIVNGFTPCPKKGKITQFYPVPRFDLFLNLYYNSVNSKKREEKNEHLFLFISF